MQQGITRECSRWDSRLREFKGRRKGSGVQQKFRSVDSEKIFRSECVGAGRVTIDDQKAAGTRTPSGPQEREKRRVIGSRQ